MEWLPLTLLCAFSLASADAATKAWLQGYSARELSLVRFTLTGLIVAPLCFFQTWPNPPMAFWAWVLALLPLEILAMLLYMQAIRDHPLTLTLPYLAFTPVFVTLTGYLLLSEKVSTEGLIGILLVVAGAWLLNIEHASLRDWHSWWRPLKAILYESGSRMMLAAAALYSLTSVMGKGAMQYMTPEQFGPFYFALLGLIAASIFSLLQPSILISVWRRPWPVLAVAALTGVMVVTHFIALQMIEVAYMIAVKRTSLLFGILYGVFVFSEPRLGVHLLAGGLMMAGVLLIAW